MEVLSFEDSISVVKMSLTLSGIKTTWQPKNNLIEFFFNHCLFYLEVFWLQSEIVSEIYWIIDGAKQGKSIIELAVITPCVFGSYMINFKAYSLYSKRTTLNEVFSKLEEIHPKFKDMEFQKEKRVVLEFQKLLKLVVRVLLSSTIFVFVAYTFLPVQSMFSEYKRNGEIKLELPFLVKFFFNPMTTVLYPIVYLHQVIATLFVCINLLASETTYFALCTSMTMHFKLLSYQIEDITLSPHNNARQNQMLAAVTKRHHDLIKLTNDVEALYSKSNLGHILISSILICLSGFIIAFNNDYGAIFTYVFFLISILSQVFLLCYFGDMLIQASSEISDAVYRSLWYNADKRSKKSLYFILMRAQIPCKLTAAGFGDINLITFTTILSRSWSYFAMLQTMFD